MWVRRAVVTLTILGIGLILLNLAFYALQPGMTFHPSTQIEANPAEWGLTYDDLRLRTTDGVEVNGWYLPAAGARRTVLILHGNAGNISHRRETISSFLNQHCNVFILDYRGFGESQGEPSEEGLYRDADAAWKYLTAERGLAPSDIIVFGRSLGGAVATHLAANTQPGGLILESTFNDGHAMATHLYPLLSRLVYLRYRFDSIGAMRNVHAPLLMLHSPEDELIPIGFARELFAAASAPKEFVTLEGAHARAFLESREVYRAALERFFATLE